MKKKTASKDRHQIRNMVRIPDDIHRQMKRSAEKNDRTLSLEVRLALKKYLADQGLWPPD